jgi:hypothetical protein
LPHENLLKISTEITQSPIIKMNAGEKSLVNAYIHRGQLLTDFLGKYLWILLQRLTKNKGHSTGSGPNHCRFGGGRGTVLLQLLPLKGP